MFPSIMTNPATDSVGSIQYAVRERPMNCDCWTPSLPTAAPGIALALEVMGPASALSSARVGQGAQGTCAGAVN